MQVDIIIRSTVPPCVESTLVKRHLCEASLVKRHTSCCEASLAERTLVFATSCESTHIPFFYNKARVGFVFLLKNV